jgi:class 3 adenylate cyclase
MAILALSAISAVAQDNMCSDQPIAPEIPSPAEMAAKSAADAASARHGAFMDIKRWQGQLKSYRDCLNATVDTDKRDLGEMQRSDKPDKDKMAKMQADITNSSHAWDASVDEEERVVNQFHAAQVAYCARTDVDRASCPK